MTFLPAHLWALMKKLAATLCLLAVVFGSQARAADLPLAAGSPLVGFSFEDRPLMLPVQRNFQMAMLTASSEIGRSCGKMEAYGWRMAQSEQQRVDQVFNGVINRLRGLGYVIEAQTPPSVSSDITMYTADRADRHFLFMSSAGEIGLVLVLCESSPPLVKTTLTPPPVQVFTQDVMKSGLGKNLSDADIRQRTEKFSPVGEWVGSYTCAQGYTGAALHISSLRGENFEGVFRFYPTAKNPYAMAGRYTVYGQYDRDSKRILINPGKWLDHPAGMTPAVMVGGFDPVNRSFSAYFQGINGCTSFEAKAPAEAYLVNNGLRGDKHKLKAPAKPKTQHKKKAKSAHSSKTDGVKKDVGKAGGEQPKAADQTQPVEQVIPPDAGIKMETSSPVPTSGTTPEALAPKPDEPVPNHVGGTASAPAAASDSGAEPAVKATTVPVEQKDVALPVTPVASPSAQPPAATVPPVSPGAPAKVEEAAPTTKVEAPKDVAPTNTAPSPATPPPAAPPPAAPPPAAPPPAAPPPAAPAKAGEDRHGSSLMPVTSPNIVAMPIKPVASMPSTQGAVAGGVSAPAPTSDAVLATKPLVPSTSPSQPTDMSAKAPTPPTAPEMPTNIVLPSVGEPDAGATKK